MAHRPLPEPPRPQPLRLPGGLTLSRSSLLILMLGAAATTYLYDLVREQTKRSEEEEEAPCPPPASADSPACPVSCRSAPLIAQVFELRQREVQRALRAVEDLRHPGKKV